MGETSICLYQGASKGADLEVEMHFVAGGPPQRALFPNREVGGRISRLPRGHPRFIRSGPKKASLSFNAVSKYFPHSSRIVRDGFERTIVSARHLRNFARES